MPDLRPLRETDVADVLALNEANVRSLAPMDETRLHELQALADRFDVLDLDGVFGGFVVTFTAQAAYDSENYQWFSARHRRFYYLDRIVLHEDYRRRGLGGFVYDEVERVAAPYRRLCLEVNLVPRNDASLAFHAQRGYVEVGRLGDDEHRVSMMEKELSSG
ncbi:MAG TPA: GNAT family N-acetyltransferase [Nocardioidaceae bacterium]|nr:GNAT family N-acetyltransferase [Nocardioidaceae bacterium]